MPLDPGSVPNRRLRTEYTSAAYRQRRYLASRRLITLGRTRRGGRNRRCHLRIATAGATLAGAADAVRPRACEAPPDARRAARAAPCGGVRARSEPPPRAAGAGRGVAAREHLRGHRLRQARGARRVLLMAAHHPRSYARCKAHGRARRLGQRRRSPRRRCSPPVHRPIPLARVGPARIGLQQPRPPALCTSPRNPRDPAAWIVRSGVTGRRRCRSTRCARCARCTGRSAANPRAARRRSSRPARRRRR